MSSWNFVFWHILLFSVFTAGNSLGSNKFENIGQQLFQFSAPYSKNILDILTKNDTDFSEELCISDAKTILKGLHNNEKWALQIVDAWGKIPSGILNWHVASLGSFEECLNTVKVFDDKNAIEGKYCLTIIPTKDIIKPKSRRTARMLASPEATQGIQLGACIPKSCSAEKLKEALVVAALQYLNISLSGIIATEKSCYTNERDVFKPMDWFAVVFFTCWAAFILMCSVYEYATKRRKGMVDAFLTSFSVFSNGAKMFQMQTIKSADVIECLHGIRSLSIIWVIFGHSYMFAAGAPNINASHIKEWSQEVLTMLLQTATVAVDSFLLMSGLLVAWLTLKQLQRSQGSLNIGLIYFHRYIRLTPVLAVLVLFCATLVRFCGSGPYWSMYRSFLTDSCVQYWWTTLLYVQNYVNPSGMCLGHSWYLSVDTQLFLFSPFIMICLWRWRNISIVGIILLMCGSIGCTFATIMHYGMPILITDVTTDNEFMKQRIYYPTHRRMSPWLAGIIFGYFLYSIREREIKLKKPFVVLLWAFCMTIFAAVMFGPYPKTQPGAENTSLESAFYESMSRTSWAIALAVVIFLCHKGYGGIINSMLSLPFWHPISRLSYSMYLTHLIIATVRALSVKTDTHFSDFDVIQQFWADFAFTFMISTVISLSFEFPVARLEGLIFKKRPTESTQVLFTNSSKSVNTSHL